MHEDIGLDDDELVRLSTKKLNELLKMRKIDKERQKELKYRRRTLKNRYIKLLDLQTDEFTRIKPFVLLTVK